ncbi:MAG: hypothetical protein AAF662_02780 [Pseudomonadota bacterium]
MTANTSRTMRDALLEQFANEAASAIRAYAQKRSGDVDEGLETPELAALLVEKYAMGIVEAGTLLTNILKLPSLDLTHVARDAVAKIDPQARKHRQRRWASRPAGINANSSPAR